MDGLELKMCKPNANEARQVILRVKILLEVCQERGQLLRWRWNESGVAGTRSTNPVLTTANFARLAACWHHELRALDGGAPRSVDVPRAAARERS
jgi:hypothetical protein